MSNHRPDFDWMRLDYNDTLDNIIWDTLFTGGGSLDEKTSKSVKAGRSSVFCVPMDLRAILPNCRCPSLCDDRSGAYGMLGLDGLLLNPVTRLCQ
jgi:hypothetical protein